MKSSASVESGPSKAKPRQGQREGRLFLSPGKPDPESLQSAIRTWIVPLLVRQFMEEHGPAANPTEVNFDERTTKPLGREGAGANRIN